MFARVFIGLMLIALTTACSTVATHTVSASRAGPYSGTQEAWRNMKRSTGGGFVHAGEFWIHAVDVPLSFVADTIILPYDAVVGARKKDELRPPRLHE